jgi:hypothetical protein
VVVGRRRLADLLGCLPPWYSQVKSAAGFSLILSIVATIVMVGTIIGAAKHWAGSLNQGEALSLSLNLSTSPSEPQPQPQPKPKPQLQPQPQPQP